MRNLSLHLYFKLWYILRAQTGGPLSWWWSTTYFLGVTDTNPSQELTVKSLEPLFKKNPHT